MAHKLLIIAFLLSTVNVFAQHPSKAKEKKSDTGAIDYKVVGAPMPNFLVKTVDDKLYSQDDFDYKANFFLVIFNPTCSHCRDEVQTLEKNYSLFKKTKAVFLARSAMNSYLPKFDSDLKTKNYPDFTFGMDSSNVFNKIYLFSLFPQINIYDKSRRLIKIYKGETAIDSLKSYIQ